MKLFYEDHNFKKQDKMCQFWLFLRGFYKSSYLSSWVRCQYFKREIVKILFQTPAIVAIFKANTFTYVGTLNRFVRRIHDYLNKIRCLADAGNRSCGIDLLDKHTCRVTELFVTASPLDNGTLYTTTTSRTGGLGPP